MSDDTLYDALGAAPGASREELRAAYRERISELEAAREGKGGSDAQLQVNRDEMARVRAAWNVLADPFQRSRYDEELGGAASADGDAADGDGADHDGDETASERPDVQLTGWRRLMAPPPPRQRPATPAAGNGKPPPPPRPLREPTIVLPPGMRIADPRARGMATLFDVAVVLVIYWAVLLVVPGMVNSDYQTKVDQIADYNDLRDAQNDIDDARASFSDAEKAIAKAESDGDNQALRDAQSDRRSANRDLNQARDDFDETARELQKDDLPIPHDADALEKQADNLAEDIRGAQYVSYLTVLGLSLLYLVPATAITGRTLGMRGRKVRVARVDGSPVGWYGALVRFLVPILLALAIPTLGPLLGLGMVLWGLRDPNGQGIHDKLARTIIVADA